ncbi:threonine-phosphate decarboxylase CobD [Photobacterium sanguinicancri]|uniref:threonine-phosphate decarboxylase CobD n=1 Tax=Photobacterium sanguinicancri TaxID=875932 RepID=UPI0026E492C7|nr:threonine-phosphate decarboxylase CobD [Photobacterium sanguinicancri]MDO6496525.1 threonine-phosphate decarboxylase CobD [Photobacterium sanguinicancri]
MLNHGGKLREYASLYQRPLEEWIDLSTGVSPWTYPIDQIPAHVWNRLPEDDDGLVEAAQHYYGCESLLPVAGSQAAIMALPRVILSSLIESDCEGEGSCKKDIQIALPQVGYKEHEQAWRKAVLQFPTARVALSFYSDEPTAEMLMTADVLVVINPNNPTGHYVPANKLHLWQQALVQRGGWLVVDEAFMDLTPEHSLLHSNASAETPLNNCVVLRSVGKFFGLAGARVGFVNAQPKVLEPLQALLGPWTVAGPSRYVLQQALADTSWQQQTRKRISVMADKLHQVLSLHFSNKDNAAEVRMTSGILFHTVQLPHAAWWHQALAKQGVLVRLCDEKHAIRFGLPHNDADLQRVNTVLTHIKDNQ